MASLILEIGGPSLAMATLSMVDEGKGGNAS